MTAPSKVGPYEILEALRKGPRPLYKARAADGRILALKTVLAEGITPDVRERFNREAAVCAQLNHPNVVRVYDSGEADGVLYLAMDLLEGADLSQVIAERRPLSWDQKLSIMEQVSAGLEFAHSRKLIHRDIKPANLFLENSGCVRILDFGMARVESSTLTKVGMAVGTLLYMAPEQIRGETSSPATDVFAAGMVFYELATGKHPFAAGRREFAKIATAIVFEKPQPLNEAAPDAPAGLDFVLERALEKDPARRLQNAGDLNKALAISRLGLQLPAQPPKQAGAPQSDANKTVLLRRPPAPLPPRDLPPPPVVKPPPPPKVETIACPICTRQNPRGITVCKYCNHLLAAPPLRDSASAEQGLDWNKLVIYILILLFLFLLGLWLVRK